MCYFMVLLTNIEPSVLNSRFLHFLSSQLHSPYGSVFCQPCPEPRASPAPGEMLLTCLGKGAEQSLGQHQSLASGQHLSLSTCECQHPTAKAEWPRAGTCCDYRGTNKAMWSDEIAPRCQKPTKPKQTQKSFISPVFIQIKWWGTTVWFSFIIEICQWRMFLELFVALDKRAVKRVTLQSPLSSTLMQKKIFNLKN